MGDIATKAQIEAAFSELRFAVDEQTIVQLPDGHYTLENPARIWVAVGGLARVVWGRRLLGDVELGAAFEAMIWGIARWQLITNDDGSIGILSASQWQEARDAFAQILAARGDFFG